MHSSFLLFNKELYYFYQDIFNQPETINLDLLWNYFFFKNLSCMCRVTKLWLMDYEDKSYITPRSSACLKLPRCFFCRWVQEYGTGKEFGLFGLEEYSRKWWRNKIERTWILGLLLELNCYNSCLHLDYNIREQYSYLSECILGCVVKAA